MRSLCLSLLIICAVFSCRCGVTSLHPLYTEKELVLQPELVGLWATADGDTTVGITLVDAAQKAYRAEIAEESADPAKPFVFSVHFVDHDCLFFFSSRRRHTR